MPRADARPQFSDSVRVERHEEGHHLVGWGTDEGGRYVEAERQHENQDRSGIDAGQCLRKVDPPESPDRVRAETRRGTQEFRRDRLHRRIEREHHVGQEHMRHRQENGEPVREQRQRTRDQPERPERAVHQSLVLQENNPGGGANEGGGPERQENHRHQDGKFQRAGACARRCAAG